MERPTIRNEEQYLLELAARPSTRLNGALQEFIRPVAEFEPVQLQVGRKAMELITLRSFRSVQITEPAQVDRDFYGEGDGLAMGHYNQTLERLSSRAITIGEQEADSGFEINGRGDARIWLTMTPHDTDRDAIVAPPIYEAGETAPDLRMYFLVNHLYFVGRPAAAVAMNSLRVRLQAEHDEQVSLAALRRTAAQEDVRAEAHRDQALLTGEPARSMPSLNKPRELFVSQVHARRSKRAVRPPTDEPNHAKAA